MRGLSNPTPLTDEQKSLGEANIRLAYHVMNRSHALVKEIGRDAAVDATHIAYVRCVRSFDRDMGFKLSAMVNTAVFRELWAEALRRRRKASAYQIEDWEEPAEDSPRETSHEEVGETVSKLLGLVSQQEQAVLLLRYGIDGGGPMTFREVGDVLGFSKSRAEQLHGQAIKKIRSSVTELDLPW